MAKSRVKGLPANAGQKFRLGRSTLIPYIEIMLDVKLIGAECVQNEKYFINEVIVGPTPQPELTLEAVHALFQSGVNVRLSDIPFRSW